jgi:hypothetical protein
MRLVKFKKLKYFLQHFPEYRFFFSKSTKRTNVLNRICSLKIPGNSQMRWNFKPRRVSADLKYSVLGFEPIWFGPTILVRRLRVMSLFWPIRHHVNQRAQSLLDARFATAIKQSINTFSAKRLTLTRGWHVCPPLFLTFILSHLSNLIYHFTYVNLIVQVSFNPEV